MQIEPIPDDCLPPQHVIDELLAGPEIDPQTGKIIGGGTYHGMTPAEVIEDRDAYRRLVGE